MRKETRCLPIAKFKFLCMNDLNDIAQFGTASIFQFFSSALVTVLHTEED